MDFITQNLLGGVAAHAALGRARANGGLGRLALAAGAIGGAVPDFDVLLRPLADPALPFQLHRHFTHALVFIPVGGLLAALPFLLLRSGRQRFGSILAATTIGCATHGLLDNLTSYGTHLLWPFLTRRTAWDAMSIIDPIFTGLLLLGVLLALLRNRTRPARLALVLALAYIGFGFVQHDRALDAQQTLAATRGHRIEHGRVIPTLGNVVVFRSIYRAEGRLWADAVRVAPFGPIGVRDGGSLPIFAEADLPPPASPRTRAVFHGMRSFADGFVARLEPPLAGDPPLVVADMRLSTRTEGFMPLWGVSLAASRPPAAWSRLHDSSGTGRDLGHLRDDVLAPVGRFRSLVDAAADGTEQTPARARQVRIDGTAPVP